MVTDYTPTTEDVRGYYRGSSATRGDEFDRWLDEIKAQAWEEGYNAKWVETYFEDNPYRQGEEQ